MRAQVIRAAVSSLSTEADALPVTVNVVSTFLLALEILPKLQETSRTFNITPTLTIVTSELHEVTKVGNLRRWSDGARD